MPYITMREFAKKYGIPLNTVQGWHARKKMPEHDERVGQTLRWDEEKLRVWFNQQEYRPRGEWKKNADGYE